MNAKNPHTSEGGETMTDPYTVDPYGEAMSTIRKALEAALDDGVSGKMSQQEHDILTSLATLVTDAGHNVDPRAG